ncbi:MULTISPECIES: hypothetical protein [unclassified Pseudomonas]|uniref:hypothetical protein n=1 Tax=unclassified Pseudomonas TaxID=196821 RepID=UPI001E4F1CCE|nr:MULTISPECIES: hypothetical protein [unclassified Pseudomonas]
MTKRDIFSELIEGFDDLAAAREGKRTLRNHRVEYKPIEPAKKLRNRHTARKAADVPGCVCPGHSSQACDPQKPGTEPFKA